MTSISLKQFVFLLLLCLQTIGSAAQLQDAYQWYASASKNKDQNDYWAKVSVDTAIRFQISTNKKNVSVAINYGQAVAINSFIASKAMILPPGYETISGKVYFTGKGFPAVQVTDLKNASSFTGIEYLLKKCQIGTVMVFDELVLKGRKGKQVGATGYCILTDIQKKDLPVLAVDTCIIEVMNNLEKHFLQGTIYFTGNGFSSPESMPANESNSLQRHSLISRLRPGSSVFFDNCIYWDAAKKVAVTLNKKVNLYSSSKK